MRDESRQSIGVRAADSGVVGMSRQSIGVRAADSGVNDKSRKHWRKSAAASRCNETIHLPIVETIGSGA